MSDIVKRLRDREFFTRTGERHELLIAADRIEALEAALRVVLEVTSESNVDVAWLTTLQQLAHATLDKERKS